MMGLIVSMTTGRRGVLFMVTATVLFFAPLSQACATMITTDVGFQTSGQSIWGAGETWGSGSVGTFDYSQTLIEKSFNVSAHAGHVSKGLFGSRYGAELDAHAAGTVGLGFEAHLSHGDVAAEIPVRYSLTIPDSVSPGSTFQITSGYQLLGGTLDTHSPQGDWGLFLNADVNAGLGGRLCFINCARGSIDKDFDIHQRLIGVDQGQETITYSHPSGVHSELSFPIVNTSGSLENGHISSTGRDQFASVGFNVTDYIQRSTGIPFESKIKVGSASIGYELLDIDIGAKLFAEQTFDFTPIPMVDLRDSNGHHLLFPAGSNVEYTMPDTGMPIVFTPHYFLANVFSSRTDLELDGYLSLEALEAHGRLGRLSANIGPLFDRTYDLALGDIKLHSWSGELGGFNSHVGDAVKIYSTPEPMEIVLVGASLVALGLLRRRIQG